MEEGFLLIDKPKGPTSHDIVAEVKRITGAAKVGHGGTLDPNATGLLIIGVGRSATKKLDTLLKETNKTYLCSVFLGEERDTHDAEGVTVSKAKAVLPPGTKEIKNTLSEFEGKIEQIPPAHSAIKIKGKKAYELARKGKKPDLKSRKVTIHSIELINYRYPNLRFKTTVSSGTYIRALARDIGVKLGIGAYLSDLRRTNVGEFRVENALNLQELKKPDWKNKLIKN